MLNNLNKIFSFNLIVLIYFLVSGAFSHILMIPDFVKALLAIPMFIFLPFVFGSSIIPLRLIQIEQSAKFYILSWLVGVSSITFIAIFLESINFLNMTFFVPFILTFCILLSCIKIFIKNTQNLNDYRIFFIDRLYVKKHFSFVIVLILSLSFPLLILWGNQFPTTFAGDELRFTLGAIKLLDDSFLPQIGPYFPYLSLMQAFASILFNVHPISFAWSGVFLMYMLFSVTIYLFVYALTEKKSMAIIATIFAMSAFYSKTINLSRFVPMTWVYVLFPLVLICAFSFNNWRNVSSQKNLILKFFIVILLNLFVSYFLCSNIIPGLNYLPVFRSIALGILWLFSFLSLCLVFDLVGSFMISTLSSGLVFLHHDLALIGIILIYLILFLLLVKNYDLRIFHKLSYAISLLVIVGLFLFEYLPIPEKYTISYFAIDVLMKKDILLESYSIIALIFSVIALVYCLIKQLDLIICVSTIAVLGLYFVNISLTIRVMVFLTPLLSYFASRLFKDLLWD